jgi:hypothetical protein
MRVDGFQMKVVVVVLSKYKTFIAAIPYILGADSIIQTKKAQLFSCISLNIIIAMSSESSPCITE